MPRRTSVHLTGFSHANPVPAASRIGSILVSGVLTGRDPATHEMPAGLDAQCANVFAHVRELMEAAGGSTDDILKMTFWLADYRDRAALNREWTAMFPDPDNRPARQAMAAHLDGGALVHCDVLAALKADAPGSGRPVTAVTEGKDAVGSAPGAVPALSADLRDKLLRAPVAGLSGELRKRGLNNVTIDGVHPLAPGRKLVGTARTLRFVPNREDLFKTHGGGYNAQKRTFDDVNEGEVIVIEARGEPGSGTLGDVLAIRAHARGAAGIVTDGGVRDADAVAAVGIPVHAAGAHPAVLGRKHVPWDSDITIACGGTTVQPGDIIVGDSDGVIVLPPPIAAKVADAALAQEDEDAWIARQVVAGNPVNSLFPMNAEWRAKYEAWRAGQ